MKTDKLIPKSDELNLYDRMSVQYCNFNRKGELILFCKTRPNFEDDYINLVYVYSIQAVTGIKKCRNIYMAPKKAEVITITEYDKIWLRLNNNIHEWNFHDGSTTAVLDNIPGVIINLLYFVTY